MGLQQKQPIICVEGVRKTFKIFNKYDWDPQIESDTS
jgi:hypothetical protein